MPQSAALVVGEQASPGPSLPQGTAATLRDLMRATVTSGRATELAVAITHTFLAALH